MSDLASHAAAYRELRERLSALLAAADAAALERLAPAAPEWRARDVLAHLSGICADINAGNLDGVATDAWTAAQVDTRRDWSLEQLLAEWDEQGRAVEALLPSFPPPVATQLLTDAATHEHDIRGALGEPGGRDSAALTIAFAGVARYGLAGGVRLETDHGSFTTGDGEEVEVTVRAPRFELFRTMTGRRSRDQILGYDWSPAPRPEAIVVGIFSPRPSPLVE